MIENMSAKKLIIVGIILLLFQVFSFMVGGFIAPSTTSAVPYLASKCVDVSHRNHRKNNWFTPWGPNQCNKIKDFDDTTAKRIEANSTVFAVHMDQTKR